MGWLVLWWLFTFSNRSSEIYDSNTRSLSTCCCRSCFLCRHHHVFSSCLLGSKERRNEGRNHWYRRTWSDGRSVGQSDGQHCFCHFYLSQQRTSSKGNWCGQFCCLN